MVRGRKRKKFLDKTCSRYGNKFVIILYEHTYVCAGRCMEAPAWHVELLSKTRNDNYGILFVFVCLRRIFCRVGFVENKILYMETK